eukprot:TRINITY_DN49463_c0_g1_i1.p1 TRINITY_DN49463_c0_g1~~TRINITY_DN49463_c0_g1_i1.p1  ORF type:complete len:403 (-),score=22.65 TRINITY_DN49463_c0_g1_i1:279-1487(-)
MFDPDVKAHHELFARSSEPRRTYKKAALLAWQDGAAGHCTEQLARGPTHSEGFVAYSGQAPATWVTMTAGYFQGVKPGDTGRRKYSSGDWNNSGETCAAMQSHDGESNQRRFETTHMRSYQGDRPASVPSRQSGRGEQPGGSLQETHTRCVQHESSAEWERRLQSATMEAQLPVQSFQKTWNSWKRGQTMTRQEHEKLWRKSNKRRLRKQAAARGLPEPSFSADSCATADSCDGVSSVMPAGKCLDERSDVMGLSRLTWKPGQDPLSASDRRDSGLGASSMWIQGGAVAAALQAAGCCAHLPMDQSLTSDHSRRREPRRNAGRPHSVCGAATARVLASSRGRHDCSSLGGTQVVAGPAALGRRPCESPDAGGDELSAADCLRQSLAPPPRPASSQAVSRRCT